MLGLGISLRGGAKDTTLNIRDTGEFMVHLVDEPIAEAMNLCAIDFPPEISEVEVAGFDLIPSDAVAPPRIGQAPVGLECRRFVMLQPARERYLVIGEVLMAHIATASSIPRHCASTAMPTPRSGAFSAAGTCAPMTASRCRASPTSSGWNARTLTASDELHRHAVGRRPDVSRDDLVTAA